MQEVRVPRPLRKSREINSRGVVIVNYEELYEAVRIINDFRKLIRTLNSNRSLMEAEVIEADKAFGDIRHFVENKKTDTRKRTKLIKLMKEFSDSRRRAKDGLIYTEPLMKFLSEEKGLDQKLGKIANEMEKAREKMDGRVYHPRVLKALFEED